MGGGKRKFPTRSKYKPPTKETSEEEKKAPPPKEDVDSLVALWQKKKEGS